MECKVKWLQDGMTFIATTGTGHIVAMDGAIEAGGNNLAPRPMELLLAGAAGCSSFDVVLILKKARQDIKGCEVKVNSKRAEVDPKVFISINFHFIISGKNLDTKRVEQAIKLSHEKYCSATIMLGKSVNIVYTFEIIEN